MLTIHLDTDRLNLTNMAELFRVLYFVIPSLSHNPDTINKLIDAMIQNGGEDNTKQELMTQGLSESMCDYWLYSAIQWRKAESRK